MTFKKDNDDDTMFPKIDALEEIQKVAKYVPYVKIDVLLDKKNYKGKRKYDNGPNKIFSMPWLGTKIMFFIGQMKWSTHLIGKTKGKSKKKWKYRQIENLKNVS